MPDRLLVSLSPWLLVTLLVACTAGLPVPWQTGETPPVQPTAAAVLPQPTSELGTQNAELEIQGSVFSIPHSAFRIQTIDVRIAHDLAEILVHPGDQVQAGQMLARLSGYATELDRDVQLVEWELTQAQARLADAEARLDAAFSDAASAHEQQVAEASDRVTALQRRVTALQRQKQIAEARLARARATTAYRQRWLNILEPLDEFDPWGDLPYLVGSQSGPKGPRSDLAYRATLAKAQYDLRQAQLAQQIAELEATEATVEDWDALVCPAKGIEMGIIGDDMGRATHNSTG